MPLPLNKKSKGDLAELKVAEDLIRRGYRIAFPYEEDWDFDLIVSRRGKLERVKVKDARSDDSVLIVRCRSHSLTNGRVRVTKRYTAEMIDWFAVYDAQTDRCYYIPAGELACGMNIMHLRLSAPRNGQRRRMRRASDYSQVPGRGVRDRR